ncbi:MAG TPA: hypothetical protein VK138_09170 [Acidiferrobacterales bacterium]|nr:hypothetical protein [Acidiferrobacterales bacterium]
MLKKSIPGLFQHAKQKRGFCFASFFKHLACLKNGGTSLYRDGQEAQVPRAQGCAGTATAGCLKTEFFNNLLTHKLIFCR